MAISLNRFLFPASLQSPPKSGLPQVMTCDFAGGTGEFFMGFPWLIKVIILMVNDG